MEKVDKEGYEKEYKNKISKFYSLPSIEEYIKNYELKIRPYYLGGTTKGYVRRLAIQCIVNECNKQDKSYEDTTILDCGSGLGALSVYLAGLGFNVIGVEISAEGVKASKRLSQKFDLDAKCKFFATSLESIPIPDNSIDFIIGHAALHHFIKYEKVPIEFKRLMKTGAKGYFADSFGENKLYYLFHNKRRIKELGDVALTKKLICNYFDSFQVNIYPTDWFVMLDKLYLNLTIIPKKVVRKLSKYHFMIDRKINVESRISLYFSGAIMTEIINKSNK